VSAVGSGTGPRLSLIGSPGLHGTALPCRERIGFQGDDDGDGVLTVADLRRLAAHIGGPAVRADPDGDGIITAADLDLLRARLLGRPVVRSVPPVLVRGSFTTIRGFGLDGVPTATVGGRVLAPAAISDAELTFHLDAGLPSGNQELRVMLGQRLVVVQPVQVQ
jgi:hypothetical protein